MGNTRLSGSLPAALFAPQLLHMLLYDSRLNGSIPSEVGLMTSLMSLQLSGNSFSGGVPSAIGLLSSLFYLDLSSNALRGRVPTEIGQAKVKSQFRLR